MSYLATIVCLTFAVALGDDTAYCPYKWQLWGTDQCLWMTQLSGHVSNAVRHCTHRDAFVPVIENVEQNNYLKTKLSFGAQKLLPLACNNNGTDRRWICNYKESNEWYWNPADTEDNKGYWNWEDGQPDLADIDARAFLSNSNGWVDEREGGMHDMAVACTKATVSKKVRCDLPYVPIDNKCIFLITNFNGTVPEARSTCSTLNGSLITIDSQQQNDFLQQKAQEAGRSRILIGCTNRNETGSWRCDDRIYPYMVHWTNESSAGFWNWREDEPWVNRSCAYLLSEDGTWRSGSCARSNRMVVACEQAPTTVQCPSQYQSWNGSCIHIDTFEGKASDAQEKCNSIGGGRPLVVDSESLNIAVSYRVQDLYVEHMILGCIDKAEEGTWVCEGQNNHDWFWRSRDDFSGYWNWRPQEPDGGSEKNCAYIKGPRGKYVSEPCETQFNTSIGCILSSKPEVSGLSTELIIGIVVGVIVVLGVVILIGVACTRRRHGGRFSAMSTSSRPGGGVYPTSLNFHGKQNSGYSDKADLMNVDLE